MRSELARLLKDHILRSFDGIERIEFCFEQHGRWYEEDGKQILDDSQINRLKSVIDSRVPLRDRGKSENFFYIDRQRLIIMLALESRPTSKTRSNMRVTLDSCLTFAENEYNASYDTLTELPRKILSDKKIEADLNRLSTEARENIIEPSVADNLPSTVTLLTIDIDFFKSVNDLYGHLYGDIVLHFFANRLINVCKDLQNESKGTVSLFPCRAGGEEFNVIISGVFGSDEEILLADRIRRFIEWRSIPEDEEWITVRDQFDTDYKVPPLRERKITASVGLASVRFPIARGEIAKIAQTLKIQSDIALQRAKSAGRNQVVSFRDIQNEYGRILQQHEDTGIVAIDLGSKVNVKDGQEFLVYHPTFSGKEPFVIKDHRSEKRLGMYPAIPCGRLEVINSQPEIAFCRILQTKLRVPFPIGSTLRAVPIGSIEDLVEGPESGAEIGSMADLDARMRKVTNEQEYPDTCIVSLTNASDIAESHGSAIVNRLLAAMWLRMKDLFPTSATLGQLSATEFAAVTGRGGISQAIRENLANAMIAPFPRNLGKGARFVSGICGADEFFTWNAATFEKLNGSSALQLARIAVSGYTTAESGVTAFSLSTPQDAMYAARRSGEATRVESTFELLKSVNAGNSAAANQAAVFFYDQSLFDKAKSYIEIALAKEESYYVFMNAALILFRLRDDIEALRYFREAQKKSVVTQLTSPYAVAIAALFIRLADSKQGDVSNEDAIEIIDLALADQKMSQSSRDRLNKELERLTKRP